MMIKHMMIVILRFALTGILTKNVMERIVIVMVIKFILRTSEILLRDF